MILKYFWKQSFIEKKNVGNRQMILRYSNLFLQRNKLTNAWQKYGVRAGFEHTIHGQKAQDHSH